MKITEITTQVCIPVDCVARTFFYTVFEEEDESVACQTVSRSCV